MPSAVLVHDNFTGPTGMGRVVELHATWLLDAGWTLTLVGEKIPPHLAASCDVVRVPAPRQLPSLLEHLGWCGRVRLALRGVRGDVIHVHSPLLAQTADIVTSHFMAQPSHLRGVRETEAGISGALRRIQARANCRVDDWAYRRVTTRTYVSFVSEFLRDEYATCYGLPRGGWVFSPPAPPWRPPTQEERAAARATFGVPDGILCVGYIGGADVRKGYVHLDQLADHLDLSLLVAGPGSERLVVGGRPGIGFVDIDAFHAACDVVLAPAAFDSAPVAVLQAVASDVPIVTTPYSGWATALARTRAGVVWDGTGPLIEAIRSAATRTTSASRRGFLAEFSEERQRRQLLAAYTEVLGSKN